MLLGANRTGKPVAQKKEIFRACGKQANPVRFCTMKLFYKPVRYPML
jgi:hypothetical protein